ncbi:aminotransferase class I/II-fold pyridoxal phosphate-dependent enzyme [Heliobacterium gestii]|uniref:Aminotransferase class I/II-fold pyridoxal phosphate-dependent enzyme n=1 Tax=Heliomicrobium gestii TaxID=2699 RepID=A0A845L8F5_HELGE|nr:DegT/DnrJ/EryC1/StrS family aminotransferase [Heliomicrobium gestii]MBM7866693.1 dTDP-4-amino-4,6-dideoxygalactose transaminase [Heliomicrobium gestii]MZP43027.1 aminotransferase class I/II-fold pyridoxal phosphate-dependent enzyme [Heliomicrobium gestii]
MNAIRWWRTKLGDNEGQRIVASIEQECLSQGAVTAELERQVAASMNVSYAVATTSGSMALLMALLSLGIGPGDEVIVPNRTFIATAHAVLLCGATVVLADTRQDLPLIDLEQAEQLITKRTKAIMPVHLCGRDAGMAEIRQFAKERGLFVVEDACQAMFSRNGDGFLGTQGDIGCFSLGVTKLLTTGQGGLLVTNDEALYQRLKLLRIHGVKDTFEAAYGQFGFNFRFNDILASIGLEQMAHRAEKVERVRAIYDRYREGLQDLEPVRLLPVRETEGEIPLYIEVLCQDREQVRRYLAEQQIESRPFLPNLHLSPHLHAQGKYPKSQRFHEQGLFLPSGPAQPMENIDQVIACLRAYAKSC